jgi:hypothetical protein
MTMMMYQDLLLCLISELEGRSASAAVRLINCTLFLPTVESYGFRSWGGLSLHYVLTDGEIPSTGSKTQIDQNVLLHRHDIVRFFSPRFEEGRKAEDVEQKFSVMYLARF